MTDHADLFPITQPFDPGDVTKALLDIADAIRGLTPNTAQDAAGGDPPASQPEPGQVGGKAAEATGGDFACGAPVPSKGGFVPRPWSLDDALTQARLAIARAEKAEERARQAVAERLEVAEELDLCRSDLIDIASRLRRARACGVPIMWTGAMLKLINRHTPEG